MAKDWQTPSPPPPRESPPPSFPARSKYHKLSDSIHNIENKIDWIERKMSTTLSP